MNGERDLNGERGDGEPGDAATGHRVVRPPVLYAGTPVVLIGTTNADGSPNLAPASSYWALGRMIVLGLETDGHTLNNIAERPELTVSFPSPSIWESVERIADVTGREEVPAAKAGRYTHAADKFALAGLTAQPSELVAPPRVAECLLQFEAKVRRSTVGVNGEYAIVEAEVIRVHADQRILQDEDHVDPASWEPLIYSFRHYFGLGERVGARPPRGRTQSAIDAAVAEAVRTGDDSLLEDEELGGDSACWLPHLCQRCGSLRVDDGSCWYCDVAAQTGIGQEFDVS